MSTLQDLSNNFKNISRRGVLTLAMEFLIFGSPGGLLCPHFKSVSVIFTLLQSGVTATQIFHILLEELTLPEM
jgi:hypothetical protein